MHFFVDRILTAMLTAECLFLRILVLKILLGVGMLGGVRKKPRQASKMRVFAPCGVGGVYGIWRDARKRAFLGFHFPAGYVSRALHQLPRKGLQLRLEKRSFLAPRRARNLLGYSWVWVGTLGPRQCLFEPRI